MARVRRGKRERKVESRRPKKESKKQIKTKRCAETGHCEMAGPNRGTGNAIDSVGAMAMWAQAIISGKIGISRQTVKNYFPNLEHIDKAFEKYVAEDTWEMFRIQAEGVLRDEVDPPFIVAIVPGVKSAPSPICASDAGTIYCKETFTVESIAVAIKAEENVAQLFGRDKPTMQYLRA